MTDMTDPNTTADPRVATLRAFGHDADADRLEKLLALEAKAGEKVDEPPQEKPAPAATATATDEDDQARQAEAALLGRAMRRDLPGLFEGEAA
jgi:hypothetical protein